MSRQKIRERQKPVGPNKGRFAKEKNLSSEVPEATQVTVKQKATALLRIEVSSTRSAENGNGRESEK